MNLASILNKSLHLPASGTAGKTTLVGKLFSEVFWKSLISSSNQKSTGLGSQMNTQKHVETVSGKAQSRSGEAAFAAAANSLPDVKGAAMPSGRVISRLSEQQPGGLKADAFAVQLPAGSKDFAAPSSDSHTAGTENRLQKMKIDIKTSSNERPASKIPAIQGFGINKLMIQSKVVSISEPAAISNPEGVVEDSHDDQTKGTGLKRASLSVNQLGSVHADLQNGFSIVPMESNPRLRAVETARTVETDKPEVNDKTAPVLRNSSLKSGPAKNANSFIRYAATTRPVHTAVSPQTENPADFQTAVRTDALQNNAKESGLNKVNAMGTSDGRNLRATGQFISRNTSFSGREQGLNESTVLRENKFESQKNSAEQIVESLQPASSKSSGPQPAAGQPAKKVAIEGSTLKQITGLPGKKPEEAAAKSAKAPANASLDRNPDLSKDLAGATAPEKVMDRHIDRGAEALPRFNFVRTGKEVKSSLSSEPSGSRISNESTVGDFEKNVENTKSRSPKPGELTPKDNPAKSLAVNPPVKGHDKSSAIGKNNHVAEKIKIHASEKGREPVQLNKHNTAISSRPDMPEQNLPDKNMNLKNPEASGSNPGQPKETNQVKSAENLQSYEKPVPSDPEISQADFAKAKAIKSEGMKLNLRIGAPLKNLQHADTGKNFGEGRGHDYSGNDGRSSLNQDDQKLPEKTKIAHTENRLSSNHSSKNEEMKPLPAAAGHTPQPANVSAPSAAQPANLVQRIVQILSSARPGQDARTSFQIESQELGKMEIVFKKDAAGDKARIVVESDSLKSIIQKALPAIHQGLAEKGVMLEALTVDVGQFEGSFAQDSQPRHNTSGPKLGEMNEIVEKEPVAPDLKRFGYNTTEWVA